jgi:hypothetical protein
MLAPGLLMLEALDAGVARAGAPLASTGGGVLFWIFNAKTQKGGEWSDASSRFRL